jgi:hypothetical protein
MPFSFIYISTSNQTGSPCQLPVFAASEVEVRSGSSRVVFCCWLLGLTLLTACYSSTLTAFLSVSKQPAPLFSSMDDLISKQPHGYKWGTMRDYGLHVLIEVNQQSMYLYVCMFL